MIVPNFPVSLIVVSLIFFSPFNVTAQNGICLPLNRLLLTSDFGYRIHPVTGAADFHKGIDLSARSDLVYSVANGKVLSTGYTTFLGNYIKISHGELISIYGHLSSFFVQKGDEVAMGQSIGVTGRSGRVTGEHLHFSMQYRRQYINPLKFLARLVHSPLNLGCYEKL